MSDNLTDQLPETWQNLNEEIYEQYESKPYPENADFYESVIEVEGKLVTGWSHRVNELGDSIIVLEVEG